MTTNDSFLGDLIPTTAPPPPAINPAEELGLGADFTAPPPAAQESYSLDQYIQAAKAETAAEAKITFEDLPDVCAEWLGIQIKTGADAASLEDLMEQLEGELHSAALIDKTFERLGATNKEAREAVMTSILNKHQGYQGLVRKLEDVKLAKAKAEANYKRYSRRFEVMKLQMEDAMLLRRGKIASEMINAMPSLGF